MWKPGDLAMVVRTSECGCPQALGMTFVVVSTGLAPKVLKCIRCLQQLKWNGLMVRSGLYSVQEYRLKRIPPLEELEKQSTKESEHV